MISQSVAMMSNPYVNQLFNPQIYQQQPTMVTVEAHHKPLPQIMYIYKLVITFSSLNKYIFCILFYVVLMKIQICQNLR